jgi:hypothetical protein
MVSGTTAMLAPMAAMASASCTSSALAAITMQAEKADTPIVLLRCAGLKPSV